MHLTHNMSYAILLHLTHIAYNTQNGLANMHLTHIAFNPQIGLGLGCTGNVRGVWGACPQA